MPSATLAPAAPSAATSTSLPSRNTAPAPATLQPRATDDEILGIISPRKNPARDTAQLEFDFDAAPSSTTSLSSRARADVWPDEGPAASSANDNQLQIPRSARNDNAQGASDTRSVATASSHDESSTQPHATQAQARMPVLPEPAHLRATFDANPELRSAWHDASAYRESFSTPEAAREATALLADVNHMDALFFSRRPEDHASLARAIANLDPAAFASLANAMQSIAANADGLRTAGVSPAPQVAASAIAPNLQPRANASENAPQPMFSHDESSTQPRATQAQARLPVLPETANNAQLAANSATANESQLAFLHAANAAAVEGVVAAIEAQVERLLPEGVAKKARTRVVGEIYRELDASLRSNPQFAAQLRDAFRSGSLDDGHQRAIVSLLTGRARQALPGVAKRVLSEWTSTIVSAANERRTRQRTAERRIDIAGSSGAGNDGRRSMSPRDLDYARLTDADILNL